MCLLRRLAERPVAGPDERDDAQTDTTDDAGGVTGVRVVRLRLYLDTELLQGLLDPDICTPNTPTFTQTAIYIYNFISPNR